MTNTSQYLLSHPRECGCPGCFARNPQGKYMAFARHTHEANCGCSVCWSKKQMALLVIYQSTQCEHCRPVSVIKEIGTGRQLITPASYCSRHTPTHRPPKYWSVVHDTGKPTPFVPLREPFELVG